MSKDKPVSPSFQQQAASVTEEVCTKQVLQEGTSRAAVKNRSASIDPSLLSETILIHWDTDELKPCTTDCHTEASQSSQTLTKPSCSQQPFWVYITVSFLVVIAMVHTVHSEF